VLWSWGHEVVAIVFEKLQKLSGDPGAYGVRPAIVFIGVATAIPKPPGLGGEVARLQGGA
jgi:hypothetical protein